MYIDKMIIDLQVPDVSTKSFFFFFNSRNLYCIILKYITERNIEFSRRCYLLIIEYEIGALTIKIANTDCNIIMKTM